MQAARERYQALDVLRGMTVAFMIIVNTPGSWSHIYAPLQHAEWHGFTPTDLVFPSFLFVIGNAFSFSMKKLRSIGAASFLIKVVYRATMIFAIGWLLNAFPFVTYVDGHYTWKDFSAIRLWGVLQRIGFCYFFAALLMYYCNRRTLILVSISILLAYWGILYFGGETGAQYTLAGNIVGKIDLVYLPPKNIYPHYEIPFDPLGLLSSFPAIVNIIAGFLAGSYLQSSGQAKKSVVRNLLLSGLLLLLLGLAWWQVFPVNKALWTSSYVVYATGWDLLLLAILILVIDIFSWRRWCKIFEVFGKNPLFIYILSWALIVLLGIMHLPSGASVKGWVYGYFTMAFPPKCASLAFALLYSSLMWLVAWWMDRKKWYIKV
ncbi:DUF5009 domain-containing protein [Chitinophaga caeni]|uniref:DUF5009 domain-containing protein n=1 Tax=Chitinophaga caeni TaxID=2029983 RepID=A0A291QZ46_9BACT|nr:DUF5009 domain-containing protein [Chitinophaga caeni]ATL49256.1 DUF5009 domain-containing protein [Chitinophaga caeni]